MVHLGKKSVDKYRELSRKLMAASLLSELRGLFGRRFSLVELLEWVHEKVEWSKSDIVRHEDPLEIIAYGTGRCGEFAILFTALCLAHDYRARLILDLSDHVWTEVWDVEEKRWVHVDPSRRKIDDPLMYERRWKKSLEEVYAFEGGRVEDVTKRYKIVKD